MDDERPDGRLPARVYWVRRAVVLIVLVAVVALVVWVVGLLTGDDDDAVVGDAPETSESGQAPTTEETTAIAVGTEDCAPAAVGLTIVADAASYPEGALPTFTVTIANTGPAACLIDAGDAQREVLITSGDDRIWSSRDCAGADTQARELLLGPAGSDTAADTTTVQWSRSRSAPGCPGDQAEALSGTYSTAFTVGTVAAAGPAVFVLD
jgi:hypothetical protein